MPDAVVIGSGPNGLVGANMLADAGWDVLVLEAEPEPAGRCAAGELTRPGFVHDRFSSFYPLGVASPAMRAMDLEANGLRGAAIPCPLRTRRPTGPSPTSPPTSTRRARRSTPSRPVTARPGARSTASGSASVRRCSRRSQPLPPGRGAARLLRSLVLRRRRCSTSRGSGCCRCGAWAGRGFAGRGGPRLLAGNALHADFSPESPGSGIYGASSSRASRSRSG
jgi:phytoene dehydrogenase-like protein